MANPLLRSNLPDLYLSTALPAIEYVIQEEYESYPLVCEQIFNVREMSQSIAQTTQVSSLLPAQQVGEAESLPMQKIYQGYSQTYTALKYAILLATSLETIDDEKYDVVAKNPRRMARSFISTQETISAAVFNNAFSDTGPDGVALCHTAHPLLAPGAGTSSNRMGTDADLSVASLKTCMTIFSQQKDSAGNALNIRPKWLLVHPDNEFLAYELCKSVMLPNSDNAAVNSVNSMREIYAVTPIVWQYLTDADAFFLVGDNVDTELNWFWRKRPSLESEIEFKTEVSLTKMSGRFTVGYSDWRGVVGSSGV